MDDGISVPANEEKEAGAVGEGSTQKDIFANLDGHLVRTRLARMRSLLK